MKLIVALALLPCAARSRRCARPRRRASDEGDVVCFKAISLANLDAYAEKHPRLQPKLKDIKMSSLIFPFKACPYLVDELIDWDMEGDIADDPFYRLVFPTMGMLSEEHREKLEAAVRQGGPVRPQGGRRGDPRGPQPAPGRPEGAQRAEEGWS